jgi:hypothetical protein
MQKQSNIVFSPKHIVIPKNNLWLKRTILIFTFIFFDYIVTLNFCHVPLEEANLCARVFMESFGIQVGLTLFVLLANLPIYLTLSLDSNIIRLPSKFARIAELFVDFLFAWLVAGTHFSGGTSWFWCAPDLVRQVFGMFLYLVFAFLLVKPHKPCYCD